MQSPLGSVPTGPREKAPGGRNNSLGGIGSFRGTLPTGEGIAMQKAFDPSKFKVCGARAAAVSRRRRGRVCAAVGAHS
jgi:hypothetical protein